VTDKKTLAGLVIIICFQVVILLCVYLNAVTPLWSGREIKLATVPVDPRSLFRGNYARLRYHISDIPAADINRVVSPPPRRKDLCQTETGQRQHLGLCGSGYSKAGWAAVYPRTDTGTPSPGKWTLPGEVWH
jgi:uncharacterized membrane-anchored protein